MSSETSAPESERHYWCFLSYRHADNQEEGRRWASWLHREIETYQVPADLVGTRNERGETIPARIFPVFRDEDELPANADLSSPIYRALDASAVLLVLCSPRAAASLYVENEIRYFKRIGKAERLLAAMLEGEPNASWDPGKAALGVAPGEECFPEALRHPVDAAGNLVLGERAEPIAADFRLPGTRAQGWANPKAYERALKAEGGLNAAAIAEKVAAYARASELAKQKIIAGILGVPLGQLVRREAAYQLELARRRSKILRRWLAAVAVLALLAAAGGVVAWQKQREAAKARDEAQAARKSADELISYMQYDLSDLLRKLGKLQLMESINERIRQYHAAHPPTAGDWKGWREQSVALEQTGDLLRDEGKRSEALAIYRECLAIDQRLLDQQPKDLGRLDDLAVSYERVGDMLRGLGRRAEALESYRASEKLRQQIVMHRPLSAAVQSGYALCYERIGDVLHDQGSLAEAMQSYRVSQDIRQRAAQAEPENTEYQRNVSVVAQRIGDILREQGQLAEALEAYRQCQSIAEKLLKQEPENGEWRRDLGMAVQRIGDVLQVQGGAEEALAAQRKAVEIYGQLAAQDLQNSVWQRDLAVSKHHLADTLYARGLLGEALEVYRGALAIEQQQAKQAPDDIGWQRDLSVSHNQIGQILRLQQHFPDALASLRAAHEIAARLAAKDAANAGWQRDLAVSDNKIGDLLRAQAKYPEALQSYEHGLAIMKRICALDPANTGWQRDLAISQSKAAMVLLDQGKMDEALAACRADLAITQRLTQLDPKNMQWQCDLAMSHERIGLIAQRKQDWAISDKEFREDLEIVRPQIDRPGADTTWIALFTTAAVSRAQILLAAPASTVSLERAAALADLHQAQGAMEMLRRQGRFPTNLERGRTILDGVVKVLEGESPEAKRSSQ